MTTRQKSVIDNLESRIQFYRYCAMAVFFLGLLAGGTVLLETSSLFSIGFLDRHPVITKCVLCFAVSLSGILTASAYRRRIRYIVERGNRILLYSDDVPLFPRPVWEQFIFEVQVLFGILFFVSAVICCVGYPLPGLPAYLDPPLFRLGLLACFFLFCRVSAKLEKKNSIVNLSPIEDFIRLHLKQARIRKYDPSLVPVALPERSTAAADRQQHLQQ
jgi:hypothetical protein